MSNFVSVKQLALQWPAFTEGAIRQLIHAERQNGLFEAKVVYRVGRKLLLRPDRFEAWIEKRQVPREPSHNLGASVLRSLSAA